MSTYTPIKAIDLHSLRLYEAETIICNALEEAWYSGEQGVHFVHGFKGGNEIKSFIWHPNKLRSKLAKHFPELPEIELRSENQGSTCVIFKKE